MMGVGDEHTIWLIGESRRPEPRGSRLTFKRPAPTKPASDALSSGGQMISIGLTEDALANALVEAMKSLGDGNRNSGSVVYIHPDGDVCLDGLFDLKGAIRASFAAVGIEFAP